MRESRVDGKWGMRERGKKSRSSVLLWGKTAQENKATTKWRKENLKEKICIVEIQEK